MSDTNRGAARGIVLTHGSMCFGMVDAVLKITGAPEDSIVALSNEGKGPDALFREVSELAGREPTIIFTDLFTGSCAFAARLVCRDPGSRRVVFGANLAMLLDFVFHRDLPLDDLVARLLEKGRDSIRALEPAPVPAADADRTLPG